MMTKKYLFDHLSARFKPTGRNKLTDQLGWILWLNSFNLDGLRRIFESSFEGVDASEAILLSF